MKENSKIFYIGTGFFIIFIAVVFFISRKYLVDNRVNETSNPQAVSAKVQDALCTQETTYKDLTSAFRTAANVCYLDLSMQDISSLPSTINVFKNLRHLNVARTYIKNLPPEITKLTALEILDISQTPIATLPVGLDKMPNLKSINADLTPLEDNGIPENFKKFTDSKTAAEMN